MSGSILDVVSDGGLESSEKVLGGGAQLLDDLAPLVDVIGAGEDDAAADQLGEDAADGPEVD